MTSNQPIPHSTSNLQTQRTARRATASAVKICTVVILWLAMFSGPAVRAVIRDGGVDPANLGQGGWLYIMKNATNKLSPNNVASVTNVNSLFAYLKSQNLDFVIVKAGTSNMLWKWDGTGNVPVSNPTGAAFTSSLVQTAHNNGLLIFGSNRSYGSDIPGEIEVANYVFQQGADGFIWDAESEWESSQPWIGNNGPALAWQLCSTVRSNWPNKFLAHNPYDTLYLHSSFPFKEFGYWCDCTMPQVYHHAATMGNASAAITWMDVNYGTWQRSLASAGNSPNGDSWTNAIKPLLLMRDVYGTQYSSPHPPRDVMEFIDYLIADPNSVTPGGYQGASYFRSELHDANQWAYIKAATVGQFSNVVNNIVLDNTAATVVGGWTSVRTISATTGSSVYFYGESGTDTNAFGTNYWRKTQGTGDAFMEYAPNIITPGDYKMYQWHPQRSDASASVPHVVTHCDGVTTVYANQQTNAAYWSLLGQFNFAAGTEGTIRITDATLDANIAMVDGLKLVFVPPTSVPATPSGLTATAVGDSEIDLSWNDNATNETAYIVARSTVSGGPYTNVAMVARNAVSYNDGGLSPATTYYYVLRATNYLGNSANSIQASALTQNATNPPSITLQPQSQNVNAGNTAAFSATVVGSQPLSYQWYFNGMTRSGATSSTCTVTNAFNADEGNYFVVVTNTYGAVTSSVAVLTVNDPYISGQPQSRTNNAGTTATFNVTAVGSATLHYQWKKNGGDISGATDSVLTLNNVLAANNGSYTVVVTNAGGAVTSSVATLTVIDPLITAQPQNQTANAGGNATFTVTAIGTPTLYYQWKRGGTNISGAIASALTLTNVSQADAVAYTVVVTNSSGSATSSVATLTVNDPPVITTQPQSRTNNAGTTATFTAAASGATPLAYQWKKNGSAISGATTSILTLSSVLGTNAGTYTMFVTNTAGTATSSPATLTVIDPFINVQPQSQTNIAGGSMSISVGVAGTTPSYQWYFNGSPLAGATGSSISTNNVQPSQAGNYYVIVTNAFGSVTSSVAALTINYSLTINVTGGGSVTRSPNQASYASNAVVTLTANPNGGCSFLNWSGDASGSANPLSATMTNNKIITANFSAPVGVPDVVIVESRSGGLNYANYVDSFTGNWTAKSTASGCTAGIGSRYCNSSSGSVTITPTLLNAGGLYLLEVTHGVSNRISSTIMVQAVVAPASGVFTNLGGSSSSNVWTSAFQQPNTNAWFSVGKILLNSGVSNVSLTFTTTNADLGSSSRFCSDAYRLTFLQAPYITSQPTDKTVDFGSNATFAVTAAGTAPLAYQWQFNGTNIASATASTYTVTNAQPANAGVYSVRVTNSYGSVISAGATLIVNGAGIPPYITTQPQDQTANQGASAVFTVLANGSTPLAYQWRFQAGNIAGATDSSLMLSGLATNQSGNYDVVIMNGFGSVTSQVAVLTVNAVTGIQLNALWSLAPGTRPYLTTNGTAPNERGMAYNPVTDHLILVSRTSPTVYVLDSDTGESLWTMNKTGVTGGYNSSYYLLMTGVAEDGAVYAGNLTLSPSSVPFKLYRWANDASNTVPVVAYSGDPGVGTTYRWGDTMDVRGSGTNTQIIIGSRAGNVVAILTTTDGTNFTSELITVSDAPAGSFGLGIAFGLGNTVWGKAMNLGLQQAALNLGAGTGTILHSFTNADFPNTVAPIGVSTGFDLIGGINVFSRNHFRLYDLTTTNGTPALLATNNFATDNDNTGSGTGSVDFGGDRVFALDGNNGLLAMQILGVYLPPTITIQPQSQTNEVDTAVNFTVTAAGASPFHYQWRFNGGNIGGATGSLYSISSVATNQAGNYDAVVTNNYGSITSQVAALTVVVPATIIAQPLSQTNLLGTSVDFSVTAIGTGPVSYQWRFNGAAIAGATGSIYSISAVQADDAGDYDVVVTNPYGSTISDVAGLTVLLPPAISAQPQSSTNVTGTTATFTVTAEGTAPLSYQWKKNNSDITGGTASALALTNVSVADAGTYTVVVTNAAGSATSAAATLTVLAPPTISGQPQNSTNIAGTTAVFTVTASGTAPLAYQWKKNAAPIAGETTGTLTLPNVSAGDAGTYTVVVTNVAGSAISAAATLTVLVPPMIATQPQNSTNVAGTTAVFTVTANGTAPLSYQWRKNGAPLAAATTATLNLPNVSAGDAGSYTVVVTNVAGSATSAVATLTVLGPPTITTQPSSQIVSMGGSVTFAVVAAGAAPLHYQWQFNGQPISGAVATNYIISNVQATNAGTYSVVVTNDAGAVTSSNAILTAVAGPLITSQPAGVTKPVGSTAMFSVTAVGDPPLKYQWRKNGVALVNATNVAFVIPNVQTSDTATYSVIVSNAVGSVTSSNAALVVSTQFGITQQPASVSVTEGQKASFAVSTAGTSLKYQWQFNGVDIVGATNTNYVIVPVRLTNAGSYAVVVSNATVSGVSSTAVLTVLPGTARPTVSLTVPKSGSAYRTNTFPGVTNYLFAINGSATDRERVEKVYYSNNASGWQQATVSSNATYTTWRGTVTVVPGTNTLLVYSEDFSGHQSLANRTVFYYNQPSRLTIRVTTDGLESPLGGKVTNATAATMYYPDNSSLFVGRTYSLTAMETNKPWFVLTNWTDGNGAVKQTNNLKCTFVMESNLVLNANFITNPLVKAGGTYNGLFWETNESGGVVRHYSAGYASIKVTPSFAVSGKLMLDGNGAGISGKLRLDGTGDFVAKRAKVGKSDLTVHLSWVGWNDVLQGTITGTNLDGVPFTSELKADRMVWSTNRLYPYNGYYTFVLPNGGSDSAPAGPSYGTFILKTNGLVLISGRAGDGTLLKGTSTGISPAGAIPVFVTMYPTGRFVPIPVYPYTALVNETVGEMIGWLTMQLNTNAWLSTNGYPTNYAPLGKLDWIKTPYTNADWTQGFTNQAEVISSRYSSNAYSAWSANVLLFTNATVTVSGGGVTAFNTPDNGVTNAAGKWSMLKGINNKLGAGFSPLTGSLSGSFTNEATGPLAVKWYGVFLQDYNIGYGSFVNRTNYPAHIGRTNASGTVEIRPTR